jgi:protein SCO1/2
MIVAIGCWRKAACALLAALVTGAGAPATAHDAAPVAAAAPLGPALHPSLPIIKTAPDIDLRDAGDRPIALSQLRGDVVLVNFIYTTCTTTCPLLTQRMAILAERLKEAGLWPDGVSFVSVSVDPERDSAAALSDYARRFDVVGPAWHFLRDAPQRLRTVLDTYDEWTRPLPGGEIDHPARLYLIDRRGAIREIYALAFFDERQAFIDIKTLVEEDDPP